MTYHMDVVAKRKAGNIEGWEPWFYQAVEGGLIIKGGVPTLVTRGKTKGRRRWNTKESQTVVVSDDDLTQEKARYEDETGKCAECYGEGKTIASASADGSRTYRNCKKCNATGAVPNVQIEAGA